MSLKIKQKHLEKIIKLGSSIVNELLDNIDEMGTRPLQCFGSLLEKLIPDESKAAIQRLLLMRAEKIESEMIENYMNRFGWVYGELSMGTNAKIMALLKVGHRFVGSYSETLYGSLHDYINRFKSDGYIFNNLWDLCHYFDVLLNLSDNGIKGYENEITDCVEALKEALRKISISDQLKAYAIWLIYRAFTSKIIKSDKSIDFREHVNNLISKIKDAPIENGLWILSNCIDIGTNNVQIIPIIEDLVDRLSSDDFWSLRAKSSFLAFTSSVLTVTDSYLEIPYPTISVKETQFFGIVAETLLRGACDLEKEKKTTDFDENSLRNRFLAILKARFNGLASSETFRCNGLTDIIVTNPKNHYEELVIECKIWRGEKYYHKAMEQAMGYLTRSEDKVIILVFSKDGWGLINKIIQAVESKPGFKGMGAGMVSLSVPTYSGFDERYLFSLQSRKDGTVVGIHHIHVSIS